MISCRVNALLGRSWARRFASTSTNQLAATGDAPQSKPVGREPLSETQIDELLDSHVQHESYSADVYGALNASDEGSNVTRDISGLRPQHRLMMRGDHVPEVREEDAPLTADQLRRRYAKYGMRSGVNPGIAYMTKSETASAAEERDVFEPSLAVVKEEAVAARDAVLLKRVKLFAGVAKKTAAYDEVLAKHNAEIETVEAERRAVEEEEERKVKEVQEVFGYTVDVSDPRFVAMLEQKEIERTKAAKTAKKLEKQRRQMASMM